VEYCVLTSYILTSYILKVRTEIKSHASALGCNYIIGYSETTSIHGGEMTLTENSIRLSDYNSHLDTCVVSASGTACHIPAILQVISNAHSHYCCVINFAS